MKPLSTLWNRLCSFWQRREVKREIDEELRFHLEQRTAENLAAGMSPEDAAREARKRFGNLQSVREECRETRGASFGETVWQDTRFGARMLVKSPGFTTIAVLSLALGIGANTAIFSLLYSVSLRSMPVHDPHELRILEWSYPKADRRAHFFGSEPGEKWSYETFPYRNYCYFRDQMQCASSVMAMSHPLERTVRTKGRDEEIKVMKVSGNYFSDLGIRALLGRTLTPADDQQNSTPVAVISYRCWQKTFGFDPEVLGKDVILDETAFIVVGVLPKNQLGPHAGESIDLYRPTLGYSEAVPRPDQDCYKVVIRLKPHVSDEQAMAECEMLAHQSEYPAHLRSKQQESHILFKDGRQGFTRSDFTKTLTQPLHLLMGLVAILLLMACSNLAGLLLCRGVARQQELSIRTALGAGRRRLMGQLLTETLLIGFAGAVLALLLADWIKVPLSNMLWKSSVTMNLHCGSMMFGFTLGLSVITMLLFGLLPAFCSTRLQPWAGLRNNTASGVPRLRISRALVAGQVSLTLMLLMGAGLLVRTLMNVANVNVGFNDQNLLTFKVTPPTRERSQENHAFHDQAIQRIAALPGVQAVTSTYRILLGEGSGHVNSFDLGISCCEVVVGSSFLRTMGIPLLKGRDFNDQDASRQADTVIINETMARTLFGDEDPTGRPPKPGSKTTIIGVCADFVHGGTLRLDDNASMADAMVALFHHRQKYRSIGDLWYLVRTQDPALTLMPAIRAALADLHEGVRIDNVSTQDDHIRDLLKRERLFAGMSSGFAVVAVLLSCIGLYGILAYQVTRRTREIGIRMALGANRQQVLYSVLYSALWIISIGLVVGLPLALGVARILRSQLWGIEPYDLLTLSGAILLLMGISLLAAYIPARRATRIDPMEALRCE